MPARLQYHSGWYKNHSLAFPLCFFFYLLLQFPVPRLHIFGFEQVLCLRYLPSITRYIPVTFPFLLDSTSFFRLVSLVQVIVLWGLYEDICFGFMPFKCLRGSLVQSLTTLSFKLFELHFSHSVQTDTFPKLPTLLLEQHH